MNIIEKITDKEYLLTLEDGSTYHCSTWIEKKKDKNGDITEKEHVIIPKNVSEICGRSYIRTSIVGDRYEFETKTTHREGLGNGGWRNRMTEKEKMRYAELEAEMEQIKQIAMSRQMTEEEKLMREMEKLQAKLAALRTK